MSTPWLDLNEFRDAGFLMEANRQFFHPLGLALAVSFEDGKVTGLSGIFDCRGDPEGFLFGADQFEPNDVAHAVSIKTLRATKIQARQALGCDAEGVQPIPGEVR